MKPLPIKSEDGKNDYPLTMTLGELYDAVAMLLNEQGLGRDTPFGMYTATGAGSVIGLGMVHPEDVPDIPANQIIMLIGESVPYGVTLRSAEPCNAPEQAVAHTEYPSRPTRLLVAELLGEEAGHADGHDPAL